MDFPDLDLAQIGENLARLGAAFVLAFPMAWDREQSEKTIGMRTFPLVAMASCAFLLLGQELAAGSPEARSRILQGTITGIGFLGGGAIVKQGLTVRGTATAAAIWGTAAMGAAVAFRRYEIAIVVSIAGFATLRWMTPLKDAARSRAEPEDQDR